MFRIIPLIVTQKMKGVAMVMEMGRKGRYSENGIDRIDHKLGMVGQGEEGDLEYSEVLGLGKLKKMMTPF